MGVLGSSNISLILIAVTLALILVLPAFTRSYEAEQTFGETWDQTCLDGLCTLTAYSYDKYFLRAGTWEEIDESWHPCPEGFCTNEYYFNVQASQGMVTSFLNDQSLAFQLQDFLGYSLDFTYPETSFNQLTYPIISGYADLRYSFTARKLKEELIFLQPLPVQEQDFTLTFSKAGSAPFFLAPTIACDALDSCTVLQTQDLGSQIQIHVPGEWFFSEERVYPITIDPTNALDNESILWNGYVKQQIQPGISNPYARMSNPSVLKCGFRQEPSPTQDNFSCAIEWNLSAISDHANVTNLILQLKINQLGTDGNSEITFKDMDLLHDEYPETEADCAGNCLFSKDMVNGTDLSGTFTITSTGVQNFTFSLAGRTDIMNLLPSEAWSFGIRHHFSSLYPANATVSELRIAARDAPNSSNRPVLFITYKPFATESEGRTAIAAGINDSLPNNPTENDKQIYLLNEDSDQFLGTFDTITESGNQTWVFNYLSEGDSPISMPSLFTVLNIWENDSLSQTEITTQVEAFINQTSV